jgi:hypothetical protein
MDLLADRKILAKPVGRSFKPLLELFDFRHGAGLSMKSPATIAAWLRRSI